MSSSEAPARNRTVATIASLLLLVAWAVPARSAEPERVRYLDTHAHLDALYFERRQPVFDFDGAVEAALAVMDEVGIDKTLLLPPPLFPGHPRPYDHAELARIVKKNPKRFAFLGGGGTLNPMIQEAVRAGKVTNELRRRFELKANEIVRDGARGFGELTAEHLSFNEDHPYEAAPPDHPLFLLLADIAAKHDLPIDLHMEAVAENMPVPERFTSSKNPKTLRENLAAFERLLAHNRKAKIVWVHAGWDNTGARTVERMRGLLKDHPNLIMSIKIDRLGLRQTHPMADERTVRPEWLELIRSFPDRFFIGSDQFYASPKVTRQKPLSYLGPRAFLNQLPPELARKLASENPARIYKLSEK